MMREFTKADWYEFAGAEKFANGAEPLVGTYKDLVVIVDANGIQAWVYEYENEVVFSYEGLCKRHNLCIAEDILAVVAEEEMTNEQIVEFLKYPELM